MDEEARREEAGGAKEIAEGSELPEQQSGQAAEEPCAEPSVGENERADGEDGEDNSAANTFIDQEKSVKHEAAVADPVHELSPTDIPPDQGAIPEQQMTSAQALQDDQQTPFLAQQLDASDASSRQQQEEDKVLKQEAQSMDRLVKNRNGQFVFIGLAVSFLMIAMILSIAVAQQTTPLAVIGILSALFSVVDLVVCVAFCRLFEQRSMHAILSLILSLASLALTLHVSKYKAWLVLASFLQLVMLCLHFAIPVDSPAARIFLPWIDRELLDAEEDTAVSDGKTDRVAGYDRRGGDMGSPTAAAEAAAGQDAAQTPQESKKHSRRIRHRTLQVFHDWPAPIPFPAVALYSFRTNSSSELPFSKGVELTILDCRGNWWQAKHPATGQIGFVPSNFLMVRQKGRVNKAVQITTEDQIAVQMGQVLEVLEVHEAACLCRSSNGKIGSVPSGCIDLLPL